MSALPTLITPRTSRKEKTIVAIRGKTRIRAITASGASSQIHGRRLRTRAKSGQDRLAGSEQDIDESRKRDGAEEDQGGNSGECRIHGVDSRSFRGGVDRGEHLVEGRGVLEVRDHSPVERRAGGGVGEDVGAGREGHAVAKEGLCGPLEERAG